MRWPLRRHANKEQSGSAGAVPAPSPTSAGSVDAAPGELTTPAPGAPDRVAPTAPRADWAHVPRLAPISSSAAPVTFHGEGFGRGVAGGRSMLHTPPPARSSSAPSGVARNIARVDTVIEREPALVGAGVSPSIPAMLHRKPVVAATPRSSLLESDADIEFASADRSPPRPVSWTPEAGFSDADEPEPGPARVRRIRTRPTLEQLAAAARGEGDDAEIDADTGVDGDEAPDDDHPPATAQIHFVPLKGRREPTRDHLESPPYDLIQTIQQVTGIHVGDAVIDRSPRVTDEADELGAVAFTRGNTVYLPVELGSLDDVGVKSIAAHELVHVAQQRARGGDVPPERSDEGISLEAQARAVQARLVAGAPVRPAFVRDRPAGQRAEAPPGVQRLANQHPEWVGDDLSEEVLETVAPGSAEDPFRWQLRDDEPYPSEWASRQAWARQYEESHSTELQRRRDERFRELMQEAGGAAGTVTRQLGLSVRQRLETEMPYQFGPPTGINPYPDPLPGGPPGGGAGGGGAAAAAAAAQPVSTAAETGAASAELVHIMRDAGMRRQAAPPGGYDVGDLDDVFQQRFNLERDLRVRVLQEKRDAAQAEGAAGSHVVFLTEDEVNRIREAVDLQVPLTVANLQYLDVNSVLTMSMAGGLDVPIPAAQARSRPAGGEATGGSSSAGAGSATSTGAATTPPTTGGTAAGADTHPESPTAQAQAGAGQAAISQIMADVERVPAGANAGTYRLGDLDDRFSERFALETNFRARVLQRKVQAAIVAGATAGTEVTLSDDEIAQIRAAVDQELPLNVPNPQYDETDDSRAHTITAAEIAAVRQATATTPTATTDDATGSSPGTAPGAGELPSGATDTTPPGAVAEVGAAVGGVVAGAARQAPATGAAALLSRMADDEPFAEDDLTGRVVEQMSEIDLEILAKRLYGRIRRELRHELLIDRERAGTLADIR